MDDGFPVTLLSSAAATSVWSDVLMLISTAENFCNSCPQISILGFWFELGSETRMPQGFATLSPDLLYYSISGDTRPGISSGYELVWGGANVSYHWVGFWVGLSVVWWQDVMYASSILVLWASLIVWTQSRKRSRYKPCLVYGSQPKFGV